MKLEDLKPSSGWVSVKGRWVFKRVTYESIPVQLMKLLPPVKED